MTEPLLRARNVRYRHPASPRRGRDAVGGVTLRIAAGEVLGLIGESGCGKSTLAHLVAGLRRPSSGEVLWEGRPLGDRSPAHRARIVQIVFQDALAALDPHLTAGASVGLAMPPRERPLRVPELWEMVGLPSSCAAALPHELSGGQRQRVCLARALAMRPRLLVADEPLSGLDMSVQAQILQLLLGLRRDLGLAMLFIAHDLAAVGHIADRVAVMHAGRFVETGPTAEVLRRPQHPLTQALVARAPLADAGRPAPARGCPFAPRCPRAGPRCAEAEPSLTNEVHGRAVACHFPGETPRPSANP